MENCQYEVVIDNERPINKPIVALTKCRIKFGDRDNLRQCVEEIRKSDLRLSLRPEEDVGGIPCALVCAGLMPSIFPSIGMSI